MSLLRFVLVPLLLIGAITGLSSAQNPFWPRGPQPLPEALAQQAPALSERANIFRRAVYDLEGQAPYAERLLRDTDDFNRAASTLHDQVDGGTSFRRMQQTYDEAYAAWGRVIQDLRGYRSPTMATSKKPPRGCSRCSSTSAAIWAFGSALPIQIILERKGCKRGLNRRTRIRSR